MNLQWCEQTIYSVFQKGKMKTSTVSMFSIQTSGPIDFTLSLDSAVKETSLSNPHA